MEKIINSIESLSARVNQILRNRVIAAALLIFQGVNMLLNPTGAPEGMVRGIAVTVVLAGLASLAGCFRDGIRQRWRSAVLTVVMIAFCVYFYITPDWIAVSLRYVIGITALLVGMTNLARMLQWNRLADAGQRVRQIGARESLVNEARNALNEQAQKTLNPTLTILEKMPLGSWLFSILTIVLGVVLLIFPFTAGDAVIRICGLTLLLGAVSDLWLALKLYQAKKKKA